MTAVATTPRKKPGKRPVPSPTFATSENPNYVFNSAELTAMTAADEPPPPIETLHPRIVWRTLEIPLDLLTISPLNCRHISKADQEAIESFAKTARKVGIIEPILARKGVVTGYELIVGRRRYESAKLAGLDAIPARCAEEMTDAQAAEIITIENLQRQDLSPLEEGEQVQTLLDVGHSVADAAAALGRTEYWISTRAKLANLTDDWKQSMADPEGILTRWTTAHLAEVAKLSPGSQAAIFKDFDWDSSWLDCSVTELAKKIDAECLLKLSTVAWKLDDADLVPKAGSCTACPKRTNAEPLLWPGLADPGKDRCTDATCFAAKRDAVVHAKQAEIKSKTGQEPLLIANRSYDHRNEITNLVPPNIKSQHEVHTVKKDTPGAKPAIYLDGAKAGTTTYVKLGHDSLSAGSKNRRSETGEPAEKSMATKRKELERKRMARAVELFKLALDEEDFESTKMGHFQLVKLAAIFGTKDRRSYINEFDRDVGPVAKGWKAFDQIKLEADAHDRLWEQVRDVFHDRLKINGPVTTSEVAEHAWAEAAKLAGLINLKAQHYLDEATADIKEPKSWATGFGTGNGPKKTSKLKQRG